MLPEGCHDDRCGRRIAITSDKLTAKLTAFMQDRGYVRVSAGQLNRQLRKRNSREKAQKAQKKHKEISGDFVCPESHLAFHRFSLSWPSLFVPFCGYSLSDTR